MVKFRSKIILSSSAALLAITFCAPIAGAQSTTDKVTSTVSDTTAKGRDALSKTADKTSDWMKGAPAPASAAEVLSRIHEVNETEIYVGKLAMKTSPTVTDMKPIAGG